MEDSEPKQGSKLVASNSDAQTHQPVHLEPPPPVKRPRRSIRQSFKLFGFGFTNDYEMPYCVRTSQREFIKERGWRGAVGFGNSRVGGQYETRIQFTRSYLQQHPYIVVAIAGKDKNVPKEVILPVMRNEDLFKQIRKAKRQLRSLPWRLLSLKDVSSFGIYECHPREGYHSVLKICDETKRTLTELYKEMQSGEPDYGSRWLVWIQRHFNNIPESTFKEIFHKNPDGRPSTLGTVNAESGKYALQLILHWSMPKIVFWGFLPILLSLAIGFWYMYEPRDPGEDPLAIVQTAWGIASYIITAGARELTTYMECK
jgi:hypothetical protein